jgi:hypothetical protein
MCLPSCAATLMLAQCSIPKMEAVLFHLSPRPWATMTVDVCLRSAGTTRAALVDIVCSGCGDYQ